MEPITLAQMSQDGENFVYVAFKYPNSVEGFDHALILIVEQDAGKDSWRVVEKNTNIDGFNVRSLDFENTTYPGGVSTFGPEDDIGRRKHLIRVNPGNVWTAFRQRFDPNQPDARSELEFYAVIAIVSVAGGVPVAQLGDLVITPTLRMRRFSSYERHVYQFKERYGKSNEWKQWMMDNRYRYEGAFVRAMEAPSPINIAFRYDSEPIAYDPPWVNETEHMNALQAMAESLYVGYDINFIFNGDTDSSYANVIAGIPPTGTLPDGIPVATSHASGENMYFWFETIFNHEFGHIMALSHHYDSIDEAGSGRHMPPGDTRCEMDKTGPRLCSACSTALNIPLDVDNGDITLRAVQEIHRRYPSDRYGG